VSREGARVRKVPDFYTDSPKNGNCAKIPLDKIDGIFFPQTVDEITGRIFPLKKSDIIAAREICINCPVFDECREWSIDYYPIVPFGIFAGEGGSMRHKFHCGKPRKDWRKTNWRLTVEEERE
jgi:Transcription factor WhiB